DVARVEGNAGTANMTFTATLSAASGKVVTVDYATADQTAIAPGDYTVSAGTLTFNPGVTTRTFTVPIVGDTLNEFDETFFANLSNPTNATIADNQGVGTITDNDPIPTLTFANVTVTEGDVGTVTATFTVTQSAASGKTVTVDYATADGTATSPADYTATSGTLTFNPGQTTKTVDVTIQGDLLNEANETYTLTLTNPTNATIPVATRTGTITDNDPLPSVVINDVSVLEGDVGTTNADFTVTLSAPSGRNVTVNYATANSTAIQPGDYTTTSGTLTFLPGQVTKTISVPVVGDVLDEIDETFFVNLTVPVNVTIADNQGIGTITDDDPLPSIVINDVARVEGNAGTANMTFTATLSAASGKVVTVDYATADQTAIAPGDYTVSAGTLT
ncbi:MAG: Calx-beta domain-containing protein, partial [Pseudonocardiaceae bacterium]